MWEYEWKYSKLQQVTLIILFLESFNFDTYNIP